LATRIRLRRMGKKKQPFYRIVVADSRMPRDGRALEELGTYNPMSRPGTVKLEEERVYDWLKKGASPSDTVNSLFRRVGVLKKYALLTAGQDVSQVEIKTELAEMPKPKGKAKKSARAAVTEKEAAAPEKAAPEAAEAPEGAAE
jgi:small subunit ribosomal protein S16